MRKNVVLLFVIVFMFSCVFWFLPDMALADNQGTVMRRDGTFLSVQFTVSSNAHATGTVYRTTGLKIGIGPYNAFFDQAYLTSKGFYSSSSSNTVDFTAGNIAERSGATVEQIRAAANNIEYGFNLGAQIKVLQNGVVKATIEEKAQVAPVFNQYGLGSCIAAAETRWGWAYDPYKPITLTMQIEGQGSTTPTGSQAPGTVYSYNLHDTVQISALPVGGWKFAYWYDVLAGNSMATTPQHNITMNKSQTIRAVFIPDAATPPAVTSPPPEPPAPEPPPPPPPPPNYKPKADFNISNPTPVEGQMIQLRDESTHPGAANGESIVSWQWTIEGQPGASSQNVNVTWDEVGTYKITLRVEDQDGDSDRCTKSVVVGPALPAAVITLSSDSIMIGREFHVDGDESTAAMERDIKWDEMEWKIYSPDGTLKRDYVGRYPLGKGTAGERDLTNSVLNQTGNWKVRLKVKDTNDNESEWAERLFTIYPDKPPIADFWLVSEALRNSYQGYELTVHDQSHPAAPDGALGDEIYLREWTLYYDGNNNGTFNDAADEIIHPGDTGKAAVLIQTSENDTNPKIRFNKTGRYKVELTVRERAEVWGVMTNGLTGDTSSKPALEKEIIVINLAPTTAFEIQKKMPVDVQFAADYTVSDAKYNSLQSSQASFIAALEAGGIDPVAGVQRVQAGEVVGSFITPKDDNWTFRFDPTLITDSEIAVFNKLFSNGSQSRSFLVTSTGQIQDNDYYIRQDIVLRTTDGHYFKKYIMNTGNELGIELIDKENNPIITKAQYETKINEYKPASFDGWNYYPHAIYPLENKSLYVIYRGHKYDEVIKRNYYRFILKKLDGNLNMVREQLIDESNVGYGGQLPSVVFHGYLSENDQLIISIGRRGDYNIDYYAYKSIGAQGAYTLVTSNSHNNLPQVKYTGNNKYLIFAYPKYFSLYDYKGMPISTTNIPASPTEATSCRMVSSWMPGKTAVMYQNIKKEGSVNKDDAYLYIVDDTTGAIVNNKQYFDVLYPPNDIGFIGSSGSWDIFNYRINPSVIIPGIIAVDAGYYRSYESSDRDSHYFSIIKPDLTIAFTSPERVDRCPGRNVWIDREYYSAINNNLFARSYVRSFDKNSGDYPYTVDIRTFIYNNSGQLIKELSGYYTDCKDGSASEYHSVRGLGNGDFVFQSGKETRKLEYYNASGALMWQKTSSGPNRPIWERGLFQNKLIIDAWVDTGFETQLVNTSSGNVEVMIPHRYVIHSQDNLVCLTLSPAYGNFVGYSQKQGLQYLSESINNHGWDNQKSNFTVSIIDSDKYEDYNAKRDSVVSQLKTNHLKLSVISPSTGQTKAQGEYIMNQAEGGWWIQTAATMPGPLAELAQKIIALVNLERGADNIVLVNQKVELSGNYSDPETDPVSTMRWEFTHDPSKLGSYSLCNSMGYSYLNGSQLTTPPTSFDKVGTFQVRYRAKDNPVTNAAYLNDSKAGAKWSSSDAYLTVLVHRKPIAAFTLSSTTINKKDNLVITDNSYDPDLVNTDPEGKKGLRNWEWQYRNTTIGEDWRSSAVIPSSFETKGVYVIRLRVRDAHGAWSDWTDQQLFTVLNNKPIADFEAIPNPVFVNSPCSLIDSSYDPDGDPLVSWEWTIQGIGTLNKVSAAPFPVSWPSVGDYLVTLRVRDNDGVWSDPVSKTVKVINYFVLTLESVSIQNGRGTAIATPGGTPPGPSGSNRVEAPVFPVNITTNEIGVYSLNQQVNLTAEPVTSGTYFLEWRDGDIVISTNTTCTISMTGNRTITAVFKKDPIFIPAVPPKIRVYIVE